MRKYNNKEAFTPLEITKTPDIKTKSLTGFTPLEMIIKNPEKQLPKGNLSLTGFTPLEIPKTPYQKAKSLTGFTPLEIPKTPEQKAKSLTGFTLIEIMVVAIIIGLLALLSIPAVLKARENAWRSKCISNLRLIGTALQVYAGDHGEEFPKHSTANGGAVLGLLYPNYLDTARVFFCPSDVFAQTNPPTIGGDGLLNNSSYAYREGLRATDKSQIIIACDRGVVTGSVDASAPHYPDGVNVVFIGGNVIWVNASGESADLPSIVEGESVNWTNLLD